MKDAEKSKSRSIYMTPNFWVYVPPKGPTDHRRDFPNQEPVELHAFGRIDDYYKYIPGFHHVEPRLFRLTEEQIAWLISIKDEVERLYQ